MVLEFDTAHDFFTSDAAQRIFSCRPVIYSPDRPSFANMHQMTQAAKKHDNFCEIFFLTKSQSWSYEDEWRMARPLEQADKECHHDHAGHAVHLFTLPASCITGVILGAQMPEANRQTIINFINTDGRYGHVALSQAKISNKSYAMDIEPL